MGRPPKRKVPATKQLHLRVTEAELAALHDAATADGHEYTSEWAIALLLRRAKKLGFEPQESSSD